MAEKLYQYEGCLGRFHQIKADFQESWVTWKENHPGGLMEILKNLLSGQHCQRQGENDEDYSHLNRRKTRKELVRISAAVMGIEFSYAAETAFVSPTLLKIGVDHQHMTLVWALSPLIGFFLTPILGSLSDRYPSSFGRRRPFILLLSLGVLIGLLLVPNGEALGYLFGDEAASSTIDPNQPLIHRVSTISTLSNETVMNAKNNFKRSNSHSAGVIFTILGTVLLDFDADACQSPSRAYLLDVTIPEDHARGLSTFTVMAGLGGFMGYALGGINWDASFIGVLFGGHVRAVFTLITVIFILCVTYTISSFKEMPLRLLESQQQSPVAKRVILRAKGRFSVDSCDEEVAGSEITNQVEIVSDTDWHRTSIIPSPKASFLIYLKSIIHMPYSIRILCLTNLFCWMAHVCYSLYFTDFVGEAVFHGDPTGVDGGLKRSQYESGVRFGCWGMAMYSLSCACYSMIIETLINRFGAKDVYVGGLLIYSSGMFLMAMTRIKFGVIVFSGTAGVMYSTLFTMPYLLIAHYHARGTFSDIALDDNGGKQIRGLGTDIAIVSSMVFLAQFILSLCMGTIVDWSGTTTAVVSVASFLAFCGAISATQVVYLDL